MKRVLLFSAEAEGSPTTLPPPKAAAKPKRATKKSGTKKPSKKSPKRIAKKAAPKRKPSAKRAKTSKRVAASKDLGGRPMLFPEKTLARFPKGYLAAVRKKSKTLGFNSQGDVIREGVRRLCGIPKAA